MSVYTDKPGIQIQATFTLIKLIRKIPEFEEEFQTICASYRCVVKYMALKWILSNREAIILSDKQYHVAVNSLETFLASNWELKCDPSDFIQKLSELAWRWKLKVPKPIIGISLFLVACGEEAISAGIKLKYTELFHPKYLIQANQFNVKIPSWMIAEVGQEKILKQLRTDLSKYTQKLNNGLVKSPSALSKHAEWWFQHYVLNKKYPLIAEEYNSSPENVKRKVWELRKLLNIIS